MSMNNGFQGIPMGGGLLNRELHAVPFYMLPSKGAAYPESMEIFVAPMRIRERRQLEGATQSMYYEKLLEGIQINGAMFDKRKLIFADVQFLDLVRRIHSFELDKEIIIKDYMCNSCGEPNDVTFKFTDIEFEDIPLDIFQTVKSATDDETGEKIEVKYQGKVYKFSDGLEVIVSPLTVGEYIHLAAKYLSNVSEKNMQNKLAEVYVAQFSYLIKDVIGQQFLNDDFRRKFVYDYISNLYRAEDEKLLEEIEKDTVVNLVPIKRECSECGETMEVYVQASLSFQQEV